LEVKKAGELAGILLEYGPESLSEAPDILYGME
jgi:hypothetical protein